MSTKIRPVTESADSGAVLNKVIDLMAPPPDIEIKITGHFPTVQMNGTSLQQVLQNLISNAIKYNDKEQGVIEVFSESNSSFYYFTIKDNGCGMEKENLENIFAEGRILNKIDRYGHLGTGLGLATVKNIVESIGGTVIVSSKPNKGTSFKFSIPRILCSY